MKQWAIDLTEAVETLNRAGVVNRFVRPETIVLSNTRDDYARPQLASFDFACLYWDTATDATVPLKPRGLPIPSLATHLLGHLPPECFTDGYDGSMVDVWSIGTVILQLLTGNSPFKPPNLAKVGRDEPIEMDDYIKQWKRSEERRIIPEEIRSLLDDVFVEANSRMTAWEMAKDFRLTCKTTRHFLKERLTPYYRIDLAKVNRLMSHQLVSYRN